MQDILWCALANGLQSLPLSPQVLRVWLSLVWVVHRSIAKSAGIEVIVHKPGMFRFLHTPCEHGGWSRIQEECLPRAPRDFPGPDKTDKRPFPQEPNCFFLPLSEYFPFSPFSPSPGDAITKTRGMRESFSYDWRVSHIPSSHLNGSGRSSMEFDGYAICLSCFLSPCCLFFVRWRRDGYRMTELFLPVAQLRWSVHYILSGMYIYHV